VTGLITPISNSLNQSQIDFHTSSNSQEEPLLLTPLKESITKTPLKRVKEDSTTTEESTTNTQTEELVNITNSSNTRVKRAKLKDFSPLYDITPTLDWQVVEPHMENLVL
jgi:hypothetical protein